jgi:hypothetical protein
MAAKKIKKEAVIIPTDLFFYPIPLTQPGQLLTRDELYRHYEPPKERKVYMGNQDEFLSFESGIATVRLKLNDDSTYYLYLHVEKEELHIGCTCGMPEERLCFHAFIGLFNLTWLSQTFDCQKLYWPNFYNDETSRKFLDIHVSSQHINVAAKPTYGTFYRSLIGFGKSRFPKLREQIDKKFSIKTGESFVYAYALCFAPDIYRDRHYPLLIPFHGKTDRSSLKLIAFSNFCLPDKEPNPSGDHQSQQQLNAISKTMYEIMRPLTYKNEYRDWRVWDDAKETIFKLWQEALPLLVNFPYNQTYLLYWLRYLREKPTKFFMQASRYSLEQPSLSFMLAFHKDRFSLSVEVIIGSQIITVENKPHFFIHDEQTGNCYMMNNIQDDSLLNWMLDNKNIITVLKEDFAEFNEDFLKVLAKCYPVFFADKPGNRTAYDYNLLKTGLSL